MIGFNNKKIGFIVDTSFGLDTKVDDVIVVPLGINITNGKDVKAYKDGVDFDHTSLANAFACKDTIVKTSQAAMPDMMKAAMEMSSQYDEVYVLPIQKALSGNFNTWNIIKEDFPKLKVVMSNTIANTLFWVLDDFKKALVEKEFNEIDAQAWFDEQSSRMVGFLLVQDMDQLVKGGRVSSFKAGLAKLFGYRPVIKHDNTGLVFLDKVKSLDAFFKTADEYISKTWTGKPILNELVLIQHDYPDAAKEILTTFEKHYGRKPREIHEQALVVSGHAGPRSCSYMVRLGK